MSTYAHSNTNQELLWEERNTSLADIQTYLIQLIEKVEDAILLGSGLEALSDLVVHFQEMYKVLRNLVTDNSPVDTILKKKILSDILHASIELSIAHDLLEEEGKKTPQFYQHFTNCLKDLQQTVSLTEEKVAPSCVSQTLLETNISSSNFVRFLTSFANDIPIWQEDLYEEYQQLKSGRQILDQIEKIVIVLREMFLPLHKLCTYMNSAHPPVGDDLTLYYRLHIALCYEEQQVEKLLSDIGAFQLIESITTRHIRKLFLCLRQGLDDIISTSKDIPEIISAWEQTKMSQRQKPLSSKNQNLRLIAP